MVSQEQWEAIRQRFLSNYSEYEEYYEDGEDPTGTYKPALDKAMEDIQLLLMATKFTVGQVITVKIDSPMPVSTCMACMYGVCKIKGTHT